MKRLNLVTVVLPTILLMTFPTHAAWNCSEERSIDTEFDIGALNNIRVSAGAGELSIKGGGETGTVGVVAKLCASDDSVLAGMDVKTQVDGEFAVIETLFPTKRSGHYSATIDLTLIVPTDSKLDVKDSSGDLRIKDVAALRLIDSSGEISVKNVPGEVVLTDSSGAIKIKGIGSAEVTDSSGDIEVRDVSRDFTVNVDSSGDIEVQGIGGNVLVRVDSSGSIEVDDVNGDFTVEKDGSGEIRYDNVKGEVTIPSRKRR